MASHPKPPKDDDKGVEVREITHLFAKQNIHAVPVERLQSIPPHERAQSLEDVHGVSEPILEHPEFVNEKISQLKAGLQPHGTNHPNLDFHGWRRTGNAMDRHAYDVAVCQNSDFVERQLLTFLRAEAFDVEKSKVRIWKHFDAKLRLFGLDAVGRDLCLDDLHPEERRVLDAGGFQLLRKRDRRGRAILAQFASICWPVPSEHLAKLHFFLATVASRDEMTQKSGMLIIHHSIDVPLPENRRAFVRAKGIKQVQTFPALPIRIVAVHGCTSEVMGMAALSVITHVMDSWYLCRFLTHFGTNLECKYNLMCFGIPLDALPLNDAGVMDLTYHKQWLQTLQEKEIRANEVSSSSAESSLSASCRSSSADTWTCSPCLETLPAAVSPRPCAIEPAALDVLMGRGNRGKHSAGNLLLKHFIKEHQGKYDSAQRAVKAKIRKQIYRAMLDRCCRFLAPSPNNADGNEVWYEMSEHEADDRIGHKFRNGRMVTAAQRKAATASLQKGVTGTTPTMFHDVAVLAAAGVHHSDDNYVHDIVLE